MRWNDPVKELLIKHERLELKPYRCTQGKLTIGVGRNLDDCGISKEEALLLLDNDVRSIVGQASKEFHWFDEIAPARQDVLISMIFNMGWTRFMGFKNMIKAIENCEWEQAAFEMKSSIWASQVGDRAVELSELMRSGARQGSTQVTSPKD